MINSIISTWLTLCLSLGSTGAPEAANARELSDAVLNPLVNGKVVMGASAGLIVDGAHHSFHYGRIKREGEAPNDSTLYEIGSITKVFTALCLAQQVVEGKLTLETPLQELLPEGTHAPKFEDEQITLLEIARHTSGLPRLPDGFDPPNPEDPYADHDESKLFEFLNRHTLRRKPGAEYEYSNLAFGLLGHLLARREETDYFTMVTKRILAPLGMEHTVLLPDESQRAHEATGYTHSVNLGFWRAFAETPHWQFDALAGAGALRSTLPDMLKFLEAALKSRETPLAEAFALAAVPRFEIGKGAHVGLGWHLAWNDEIGETILWHNGGTGGFHSFLAAAPVRGVGVVLLANTSAVEVDQAGMDLLAGAAKLNR